MFTNSHIFLWATKITQEQENTYKIYYLDFQEEDLQEQIKYFNGIGLFISGDMSKQTEITLELLHSPQTSYFYRMTCTKINPCELVPMLISSKLDLKTIYDGLALPNKFTSNHWDEMRAGVYTVKSEKWIGVLIIAETREMSLIAFGDDDSKISANDLIFCPEFDMVCGSLTTNDS